MTSCSLQEKDWPQIKPSRSRVFSRLSIASGSEKAEFLEEQLQNVLSVTYQGSEIPETPYVHPKPLKKSDEIEIDTDFEYSCGNVKFEGAYEVADSAKKPKIVSITPKCEVSQLPIIHKYYKFDATHREYFVHHFRLCKPNLTLILPSTTDLSPENAIRNHDPNYMKNFLSDMRQIIRNTDTWVLTNGLNWGLTRIIGESIATRVLSPFTAETIELIGIQKFEKLPPTVRNCISRLSMKAQLEEDTIPRGCLEENHSLFLSMKDNLDRDEIETFWDTIEHTEIIKRIEAIKVATCRESIVQDLEQKWDKSHEAPKTKTSLVELSTKRNSEVSESVSKPDGDIIELGQLEKANFAIFDDEPSRVERTVESGPRIPSECQNLWFKQIEFKDPDINPAVCLLLDNSIDGLKHALHAIRKRVPTVLVIGSGIAADMIHQIMLLSRDHEVISISNEVREYLKQNYPIHALRLPEDILRRVISSVVSNEELFTFYHPLRHGIHELNKAILLALLKGYPGENKRLYGLILSFRWKRPSLALEKIFIGREKWISEDDTRAVQRIFFSALTTNNTGFVHRMLESKIINFRYFGNMYYLSQLYKRTFDKLSDSEEDIIANKMLRIHFSESRHRKDPRHILHEIGKLIEVLMGHDYVCFYNHLPISRKKREYEEENIKKNVNNCYNFLRYIGTSMKQCLKRFRVRKLTAQTKKLKLVRAEKAQKLFEQFAEEQVFIWCLLFHRWEMAILILKYCNKTCLTTVLSAARLIRGMKLKYLSRTDVDEIARNKLEKQSNDFENLAVTLLAEFSYSANSDLKLKLLLKNRRVESAELIGLEVAACQSEKPLSEGDNMREQDDPTTYIWPWHENNAFDMAIKGDCKHFIAHPLIQDYANQKWYSRIRRLNKEWKLIVCFFIPFLIPFVLELHSRRKRLEHHMNPHKDPVTKETRFRQKSFCHFFLFLFFDFFRGIYNFYNAPKIKYWLHFLSHLVYTILFTIVGVTPYRPIRNRTTQDIANDPLLIIELIIWVWTFTIIMEECSQLLHEKGSLLNRIRGYISSAWNILDLGLILLFLLAFSIKLGCDCGAWVHRVYALIILILYIRIFQYLIMSAYFGVIVLIIFALGEEVVYFVFVLLLSMIGFGAAMQTVVASDTLYEDFQAEFLLFTIFFRPYWQLFGEFFLPQLGTDISSGSGAISESKLD